MPAELPLGDDRPFPGLRSRLRGTVVHDWSRRLQAAAGARREAELLASVRTYCLFLGHARSGHSIVGALLDAHPQIAISDELGALRYVKAGLSGEQVMWLSLKVAGDQARRLRRKRGRGGSEYSYHVPGQWQGRWSELRVVGDSDAGATVRSLAEDATLLDRLWSSMRGREVRFIHVIRNPYDNIATMMLRSGRSFESAAERYFENWRMIEALRKRIGDDAISPIRHEELVAAPSEVLATVCRFLGVEPRPDHLEACSRILFRAPSRSRDAVDWIDLRRRRIEKGIAEFAALDGYTFDT
jgi:hypothetical protein